MNKKLGIIMPVKNQEKFVQATTEAMMNAINRLSIPIDTTLILIDDGSDDASIDIIEFIVKEKTNPWHTVNIDLIKTDGLKPAWARNKALEKWKDYDYFAFLDSDDIWYPNHLQNSLTQLETIGCDLVYSDVQGIRDTGEEIVITGIANPRWFSMSDMERANFIFISTVVMRAKCAEYDKMSKWAEPFPDWEYWHRLSKKYHMHHLNEDEFGKGAKYLWKTQTGNWTYYNHEDSVNCNNKIIEWREFNWPHRVDGWMSQTELDFLRESARGKKVLECGAYKGKSTSVMALDALSVDSIDTFECAIDGQTQTGSTITLDAFNINTSRFGNVKPLIGMTTTVLPTLEDASYDFCFIDAMHDYDSVLADLELAFWKVKPGGKIAFHDYFNPDYPGVAKAVQDFLANHLITRNIERHDSIACMNGPSIVMIEYQNHLRKHKSVDQLLDFANTPETKEINTTFIEGAISIEQIEQNYNSILDNIKNGSGGGLSDFYKIPKETKKVVIAPFAVRLPDGRWNPKSPQPSYWQPIVTALKRMNFTVIHVGSDTEPNIDADIRKNKPSMEELTELINESAMFVSVDTFLQHFANYLGKPGVVIWSQSDPNIFGYPENTNLLSDRKYLREQQFQMWTQTPYMEEAFPSTETVIDAIDKLDKQVIAKYLTDKDLRYRDMENKNSTSV